MVFYHALTLPEDFLIHTLSPSRFYDAGMPAVTPTFNKTLSEESEGLADVWARAAQAGESELANPEAAKFEAWTSPQKVCTV